MADQKITYTKKIIEIPVQIKVSLQEHHMYQYEGKCGATTPAGNPTLEGTSLGVNLLSFLSTTRKCTGGSFENLALMIDDLSDKKISQTTLNRGLSAVNQLLMPERDQIAQERVNSAYINSDETGHKLVLEGERSHRGSKKIWVFATPSAAYYYDETKAPPICVSNAYPAYMHMFETHQYCWLLRDMKEVENDCLAGKILHDERVDLFQRIKALQKKLRVKNETAIEKVYKKALKEINDISEARHCKNVEYIISPV